MFIRVRGLSLLEFDYIFRDLGAELDEIGDYLVARESGVAHLITNEIVEPDERVEIGGQGPVVGGR